MSSTKRKGKSRAIPTETESLLPSSSHSPDSPRTPSQARLPRQTTSYLFTAGLVIFSAIFTGTLFLLLLGYSFKPSEEELAVLPSTAFAYSGPQSIHVLDITDHGVLVNVTVRLGIDADLALGTKKGSTVGQRGQGVGWWEGIRRWTARQALAQLPQQAVNVAFPETIDLFPAHFSSPPLLSLLVNQSVPVPLVLDVKEDKEWLKPVSFVALARPVATGQQLWDFVHTAWSEGQARVIISVPTVAVGLPEGVWWSKYGQMEKQDLTMDLSLDIPPITGLPAPGHQLNVSELVRLDSYHLQTSSPHSLSINASASLPNPFSQLNLGARVPFAVPFLISLDDGSPMAKVTTSPFTLDDAKDLHISLAGDIIANLTAHSDAPSLSLFLQRFLHGQDNPIIVSGLEQVPPHTPSPPPWILSLLPTVSIPLSFPGPQPPPKVIKTVSIEHMRISERGGQIYASGTVMAKVELPETMQRIQLDVKGVSPDVLIYDGPAGDDPADPDDPPLRAFGRINPDDFLNSTTAPSDDPLHPYAIIVSAPMVNVPLQILEGRESVFRSFASKVVFKGGAEAGIKGTASVKVDLKGVEGRAKLADLPVTGETWVGRQRSSWLSSVVGA